MVTKVHLDGANRRRLIVRGRDVDFWTPAEEAPGGGIVWAEDFDALTPGVGINGDFNGPSDSAPGASSVEHGVTDAQAKDGANSLYITLTDSEAGTGSRHRVDNQLLGSRSAAENLPDGYYSVWVLIPTHITVGNGNGDGGDDAWNIFQWKQTWPNGDGSYTRRMIASISLRDWGSDYAFTYASRAHDDGTWGDPKDETFIGDSNRVVAGQWFHIEVYRVFSDDPAVGRVIVWIDGVEIFDHFHLTEMTGGDWDDYPWRRQWTINSYHTGGSGINHSPNTHTLYFDDARVATARQGAG